MSITAFLYDAERADHEIELGEDIISGLKDDQLLWIDLEEPEAPELAAIAKVLDLTPRMLAKVSDPSRVLLDNYPKVFAFGLSAPPTAEENSLQPGVGQLGFIVGRLWLLTIHSGQIKYLSAFRAKDKGETAIGRLSPAQLVSALLDWHLTEYFTQVAEIEASVDELDEHILVEGTHREVLGRIVAIRARVSKLRAQLAAQRPIFYGFSRSDFSLNFGASEAATFRDLAGRYERAIDEVERTREVVVGSFELFTSMTTQQTNDLVKALTFLTAVIGFCAAVAGLLGMNFELPFFQSGTSGFMIVSGSLTSLAVLAFIVAKWRHWI